MSENFYSSPLSHLPVDGKYFVFSLIMSIATPDINFKTDSVCDHKYLLSVDVSFPACLPNFVFCSTRIGSIDETDAGF